jgi:Fur family zinc uptake transcriptional regulator
MLSNSRVAHQPHDHSRCIHAALARARVLCDENEARLTRIREDVFTLIWQSHRPIGAYQIQDQLAQQWGKRVAPPTVYRAIEFLSVLNLIHRIPSLNAFIGCPFPNSAHSHLFLICENCGSVAEMSHHGVNTLLQTASEKAQFTLQSQCLELFGLCPQCTQNRNTGTSAGPTNA